MLDPVQNRFDAVVDSLNRLVRPVLAFWFGAAVAAFTYLAYLTPDAFLAIAGMVIGFFFRGRDEERREQRLERQQEQLVALAKEMPPDTKPPA